MSKASEFRLHLTELRETFGVRCETCDYFDKHQGANHCSLHMRWRTPKEWCVDWDEGDET